MHITPPTPEQAEALRARLQRTGDLFRRFLDAFAEAARRWVAPALRAVDRFVRAYQGQAPAPDPLGLAWEAAAGLRPARVARPARVLRPAWASPYGPAPRRSH